MHIILLTRHTTIHSAAILYNSRLSVTNLADCVLRVVESQGVLFHAKVWKQNITQRQNVEKSKPILQPYNTLFLQNQNKRCCLPGTLQHTSGGYCTTASGYILHDSKQLLQQKTWLGLTWLTSATAYCACLTPKACFSMPWPLHAPYSMKRSS